MRLGRRHQRIERVGPAPGRCLWIAHDERTYSLVPECNTFEDGQNKTLQTRIPADALPRQLLALLPPQPDVLELGCGAGGRVDAYFGRARAVDGRRYLGGATRPRARACSVGDIRLC